MFFENSRHSSTFGGRELESFGDFLLFFDFFLRFLKMTDGNEPQCFFGLLAFSCFKSCLRGFPQEIPGSFQEFLKKERTPGITGALPAFCDGKGQIHLSLEDGAKKICACQTCFNYVCKGKTPRIQAFDSCSCEKLHCTATGSQLDGLCFTKVKHNFLGAFFDVLQNLQTPLGFDGERIKVSPQVRKRFLSKVNEQIKEMDPFYGDSVPTSSSDGPPPPTIRVPHLSASTDSLAFCGDGPTDGLGAHQEIHMGDPAQVPNQVNDFGQHLSGGADLSTDDVALDIDFLDQFYDEPHHNSSNEDQIFRVLEKNHKELLGALNRQNAAADLGNAYASLFQRQTEAEQKEKELQEREAVIAAKEQQRAEIDAELQEQREMVKELRDKLSSGEERFKRSREDWEEKTSQKRARFEEELEKRQSEFDAQLKERQGLVEALEQQLSQEQEEFTGRIAEKEEARASLQKANADLSQRLETAESNLKKYEETFAQVRDLFKLE